MSLNPTSTCLLNLSMSADSSTSVGNPLKCLITISVNKFFQISNLNLPWCNLRPLPHGLSHYLGEEANPHLVTPSFLWRAIRSFLGLLLSRLNNTSTCFSSDLWSRPFTTFIAFQQLFPKARALQMRLNHNFLVSILDRWWPYPWY